MRQYRRLQPFFDILSSQPAVQPNIPASHGTHPLFRRRERMLAPQHTHWHRPNETSKVVTLGLRTSGGVRSAANGPENQQHVTSKIPGCRKASKRGLHSTRQSVSLPQFTGNGENFRFSARINRDACGNTGRRDTKEPFGDEQVIAHPPSCLVVDRCRVAFQPVGT